MGLWVVFSVHFYRHIKAASMLRICNFQYTTHTHTHTYGHCSTLCIPNLYLHGFIPTHWKLLKFKPRFDFINRKKNFAGSNPIPFILLWKGLHITYIYIYPSSWTFNNSKPWVGINHGERDLSNLTWMRCHVTRAPPLHALWRAT
jgi:hypothetical protein